MNDYMKALHQRFFRPPDFTELEEDIENTRREVRDCLGRMGRRKLMRLVDTQNLLMEKTSLASFISGFTLAWGIAKELKAEDITEADIHIAAGLPLTWTSGQKADFAAYLAKNEEVDFIYKKAEYHIRITGVSIYPQGYAAIAPFATKLTGINLIADIGNGTMNVLYMINGKPQSGKMFTEKFGTYQCTLAVREAFMQKTHREINDYIIEEVLRTGTADISAADLKIIKSVASEYVRDIFRRLREHGYDESTMRLYVTGGGGCLIKNFYKLNADRTVFVEDICAAAKGYEYLAEIQLSAGKGV